MTSLTATTPCPYPGLRAFFTEERDWYFGREAHVDAMLTRLETSRFLAVVGSSGSGKSSLIFAGLIPALREGQLAGSRHDAAGEPAGWHEVNLHPGNDPLDELTVAIVKEAKGEEQPHLAGYVRAALESGDQGLTEALGVAGLVDERWEILIYVDQFEELFRFGEKSSRAAQESALRFAQLLVAAAERSSVRLHILLSMRSEFIGECERFPGLPELVSRSQFLAPRLTRRQLEQALACPAVSVGWKIAPDTLAALLNDCGNSPDQLPLAQHVLRRMWKHAAKVGRTELSISDYTDMGGIRGSVAEHGREILGLLPQPGGPEVARLLFMALSEQREDGPLVRRLSTREEVEAIAGEDRALVPSVVQAFGGTDAGFLREEKGWLDVRHEAVLRQWPLIGEWRAREADSEGWLRELSHVAREYVHKPEETELWKGNDLRGAEEWRKNEKPSDAWARRHGVKNWEQCMAFLARSRETVDRAKSEKEEQERLDRQRKERAAKRLLITVTAGAAVCLIVGAVMFFLWNERKSSQARAEKESASRLDFIRRVLEASVGVVGGAQAAILEASQQNSTLTSAIAAVGNEALPDSPMIKKFNDSLDTARAAVGGIVKLADAAKDAAATAKDEPIKKATDNLVGKAAENETQLAALNHNSEVWQVVEQAVQLRLDRAQKALKSGGPGKTKGASDPISSAIGELDAINAIRTASIPLGFEADDFEPLDKQVTSIKDQLASAQQTVTVTSTFQLTTWDADEAVAKFYHSGRVNRICFAPGTPLDEPIIASACEDGHLWVWKKTGDPLYQLSGSGALNDVAFNKDGNAAVLAGDGKSVPVFHWTGPLTPKLPTFAPIKRFAQNKDSVTDVEFSHGGAQIATAGADCTVRVFDSTTMEQRYFSSPPLPGIVTSVMFHRGDNLVISGCDDGGVRLHTIDHPGVQLLGKLGAPARRPEFSTDGKYVIAASGDRTARVWSVQDPQEIVQLSHPAPVTEATFRPAVDSDGYTFVTCATNGEVRSVHVTKLTGTSAALDQTILQPRHLSAVRSASWGANGNWMATAGGGEVLVWKWTDGILVAKLKITGLHPATSRTEFSPDARWLVTYGGDYIALLWDLNKLADR